MSYSNQRKLALCGWLKTNLPEKYASQMYTQMFLFLYETLCMANDIDSDFKDLKLCKTGPVFSEIWTERYNNEQEFNKNAIKALNSYAHINTDLIKISAAIISTITLKELNDMLIAKLNGGFSAIQSLQILYEPSFLDENTIIEIGDNRFVFSKEDIRKFTPDMYVTLCELSDREAFENPIYTEIDENGTLIID